MSINHHPSEETLLCYAGGTLTAGPSLVVSVHLNGCAFCRARLEAFEAVGGALLEGMPAERIQPDAFTKVMRRIETSEPLVPQKTSGPVVDGDLLLPSQLAGCRLGAWRWLGPGMRWKRVSIPWSDDANVVLLRVGAGRSLPWHTHIGTEFTQVLCGSFADARGHYTPGDLDEADAEILHQPVVDEGSECISLAALDGDIRLQGMVGRALRLFIGF